MESAAPSSEPVLVVTGAGGGLGARTVELFAARGWRVVAADLEAPPSGPRVTGVAVDVTDDASVARLAERVRATTGGRVDAVVTFAGVLEVGPLAELDPRTLARVLDVNVVGTARCVRALFPLLRSSGGRVVLVGSETGPQHAMPFNGPYAMSKHAIEAYADAARRELTHLGVPVVLLQPGPFRTGMTASIRAGFAASTAPGSPFRAMAEVMGELAAGEDERASDPWLLAGAVWRAVTAERPRARYAVRWDRGRALLDRVPVPVVDAALRRVLGPRIRSRSHGEG